MTTPQSQAEAMGKQMARELLHSRIHSKTKFEDTLATALSKLIAENERLKKELKDSETIAQIKDETANTFMSQVKRLQSQLTATEAKLKQGIKWMTHKDDCPHWEAYHAGTVANCECGLELFLSTLTAEKKESE